MPASPRQCFPPPPQRTCSCSAYTEHDCSFFTADYLFIFILLGLRQKCFSLDLITSPSRNLSQSHRAPQGSGSASCQGGQRGGLGQQHWLKRRISLSKSLLGFCPQSAPFVGFQIGTQPCRATFRGTKPLQWVIIEWITIGSDSSIASTLQTFTKHLYFHYQLCSPKSTTVHY